MREQIGPWELSALLFSFLIGSSLVLPMGTQAKQASWLAVLLGGAAGLGIAWVCTALALRFPDQSLIRYSKQVLGPWLGGLTGLLYLWYGLHLGALVLRNFGEFLVTTILPGTPISVPMIILMGACAFGVRHGLEVLGRAAQVMVLIVVAQVLLVTILLLSKFRSEYLAPILGEGWVPILQGAFSAMSFPFGESVLFALLLPMTRPARQVRPTVMLTMTTAILFLAMMHARNMAVLGAHLVETARFPTFSTTQVVDIADFLTRLDAFVVGNWIVTGYTKVAVCLLVTGRGFAEWTGLKEYRPLVLPLAVIMAALAVLLYSNVSEMASFAALIWPVYSVPFQILMPVLLLGVAAVRGRGAK